MAKRKTNKRVFARIISLQMLIRWQLTAIMVGMCVQLAFSWWHHEMTMTKMDGMIDTTVKVVKICNHVGIDDCNEIRKILKGE